MQVALDALRQRIVPRVNRGSYYLKYLVCLQLYAQGQDHSAQKSPQMAEFMQQNSLSIDQYMGLADILGGDLQTVRTLAGPAYSDYTTHIDYKMRNAGFTSDSGVEEAWANLNHQYSSVLETVPLEEQRVEIMQQLAGIFSQAVSSQEDMSKVSQGTIDQIINSLTQYQGEIIEGIEDLEMAEDIQVAIDEIILDLEHNPTFFLVDSVSWIDGTLRRAGRDGVSINSGGKKTGYFVVQKENMLENSVPVETIIREENTEMYLQTLNQKIQTPLQRFMEDSEGRIILLENENNLERPAIWPAVSLVTVTGICAYSLVIGTAPVSQMILGPMAIKYRSLFSYKQCMTEP